MSLSARKIYDADGKKIRLILVAIEDITERRQMQDDLHA